MKKVHIVIIAVACIGLIFGGFFIFSRGLDGLGEKNYEDLTDVEKIEVFDLEKDYPKTPREVMKFYNQIVTCYYSGEVSDEDLEVLVDKMLMLFDEELLLSHPRDEYLAAVKADVESYKQKKKTIVEASVCDSKEVDEVTDPDTGAEVSFVEVSYFIKTNGKFSRTHQEFMLRKDDDGQWKILYYQLVGGESSDDDE